MQRPLFNFSHLELGPYGVSSDHPTMYYSVYLRQLTGNMFFALLVPVWGPTCVLGSQNVRPGTRKSTPPWPTSECRPSSLTLPIGDSRGDTLVLIVLTAAVLAYFSTFDAPLKREMIDQEGGKLEVCPTHDPTVYYIAGSSGDPNEAATPPPNYPTSIIWLYLSNYRCNDVTPVVGTNQITVLLDDGEFEVEFSMKLDESEKIVLPELPANQDSERKN
eukprot:7414831-Pyramimonas_sp.AAC.1